jgi:hypothetical protein
MSGGRLWGRVRHLERSAPRCRCAEGVVILAAVLTKRQGEPDPPLPDDLPSCPVCGTPRPVLIEEIVIVRTREDLEAQGGRCT